MNIEELIEKAESLGYVVRVYEGKIDGVWAIERQHFYPEILGGYTIFGKVEPWGVNWSAYGTKTAIETEEFIRCLQDAVKVVEMLNEFQKA